MFHTAAKQLESLEAQLACITEAVGALRKELSRVADSRRTRCSKAYHKDIKKTRERRNAYYQSKKGERATKVPCSICGKKVRQDYMARHQKTSRCVKAPQPICALDKPPNHSPAPLLKVAP